jgi:hypothetical protein
MVRRVPAPLRLALPQIAIGFVVAGCAVGAILGTDFNGLGTLLRRAEAHPWPAAMLWFFLGTSFSAVQIGIAVMRLGPEREGPSGGAELRPVPVRIRRR